MILEIKLHFLELVAVVQEIMVFYSLNIRALNMFDCIQQEIVGLIQAVEAVFLVLALLVHHSNYMLVGQTLQLLLSQRQRIKILVFTLGRMGLLSGKLGLI